MAAVIALALRDRARAAMIGSGGRGFMRFAPEGGALLATDAVRRCADGAEESTLIVALEQEGFVCERRDGLLLIAPGDALIAQLGGQAKAPPVDWESPLHPAAALAARWVSQPASPLTAAGRRLVIDTLRLTGMPGADVTKGLDALRAQAAVMLRAHDRSGMREAGMILSQWCEGEDDQ